MAATPRELISIVVSAQQQLAQLEHVSKSLVDELASNGAHSTPLLRELLSRGDAFVGAVQQAAERLGSALPEGPTLPAGPSSDAVDAVWERQQRSGQQEATEALPTPVSHPAANLADLVASLERLPCCTLTLLQGRSPAGQADAATAVLLRCGRAFVALVQLQVAGSMQPLRVSVLSTAEAAAALAPKTGSLWALSQHAVFQQLTRLAAAALRHYLQESQHSQDASALELLLLWLATHSDVFSRQSSSSSSLLLADAGGAGSGLLPPLRRPVRLSWQELWQAAVNPHLRQAEHLTAAF